MLSSRSKTILWCKEKGLIKSDVECPKCGFSMTFDSKRGVMGRWRCNRRHQDTSIACKKLPKSKRKKTEKNIEISASINSWFFNTKLAAQKVILLTNCWCADLSYEQTIFQCHSIDDRENQRLSMETVCDWYSYCREVAMDAIDSLYNRTGKIGGIGHIVEIDETKIGKRKYNRGRMIEGSWIFGMIDITSTEEGNYRLEICEDNKRDEETLMSYIIKHVKPGSTIYSDCLESL